jgi:uncharacterized protein (DUF488 family)
MKIWTVGHGAATEADFAALVGAADIASVADVRRYPGSRRHPHFAGDRMARWLANVGIGYRWLPGLGGRRRPEPDSLNVALRNPQFRGYADHMASAEFGESVGELLAVAASAPTAVMCSESVWWRCHRRLLADHLVLVAGIDVVHLLHDGRLTAHPLTGGVRRDGDRVVYDDVSA